MLTGCGISTGNTCPGNSNALTCLVEAGVAVVLDISTDAVLGLVSWWITLDICAWKLPGNIVELLLD